MPRPLFERRGIRFRRPPRLTPSSLPARVLSFERATLCHSPPLFLAMPPTTQAARPDRAPLSRKAEVFREAVQQGAWDWTRLPLESARYNSEGTGHLCQALARGLSAARVAELSRRIEEEALDGRAVARLVLGWALDEMSRQLWVGVTPGQAVRRRVQRHEAEALLEAGASYEEVEEVTGLGERYFRERRKREAYEARYEEARGKRKRRDGR